MLPGEVVLAVLLRPGSRRSKTALRPRVPGCWLLDCLAVSSRQGGLGYGFPAATAAFAALGELFQTEISIMSKRTSFLVLGAIAAALTASVAFAQSGGKAVDTAKTSTSSSQDEGLTEAEKKAQRRAKTEAAARAKGDTGSKAGGKEEEEEAKKP